MSKLTDAQRRLVELDLKKKEIEEFYEQLDQAVRDVESEIGLNGFFQSDDGTVYQIVKPTGTFISYKDISFIRTKRDGEERGSLSVKKAQEAGFTVKERS
jgi:hypothetical protein